MRKQLERKEFEDAIDALVKKLFFRVDQKGLGAYASGHEILGIIQDEVYEFRDEVHGRGSDDAKVQELLDIAVGAIWGIASITSGGVDW